MLKTISFPKLYILKLSFSFTSIYILVNNNIDMVNSRFIYLTVC